MRSVLVSLALAAITSAAPAVAGTGAFTVSGDSEATIEGATASFSYIDRAGVWMLQIRSPGDYKKAHGSGYSVNLFFAKSFAPAAGTFPIRFSYRNAEDTLGGSVRISGDGRVTLSHDTTGTAVFTKFGDQVSGTFELTVHDKSADSEGTRRTVKAEGNFHLDRGDALPD